VEYFVTVAEELHFGRAAARLRIAQPSLSHQIRRLEQQLGVVLLERTSRHVRLTPSGETLLVEGRRLLRQSQRAVRLTRGADVERLAVGFAGSAATGLLADVLAAFRPAHPAVEVAIRELLLDRVEDISLGEVDVAFTRLLPGQVPDLEIEVIAREPRLAALPASHPLSVRESVTFADLRDERFIVNPASAGERPPARWIEEQRRHGLPGHAVAEAASVQEILELVAAGRGICLVPAPVEERFPRRDVRYVPVTDADAAVVSLARPKGSARPVVRAFIEAAWKVARARGSGS
jgi:DNA-binding transcriptional LysR family regulator